MIWDQYLAILYLAHVCAHAVCVFTSVDNIGFKNV